MVYRTGQILDDAHRIVDVCEGGMATVYILEDIDTGARIAAKTIRDEFLADAALVARFRREMRIWVGLGAHPNIVRAFSIKDIRSHPFLFMEYMDGGSLLDLLRVNCNLPSDMVIKIAIGIAQGMDHVHNRITPDGIRGILHRDLKPANMLLSNSNKVKVADFGLARAINTTLLTQTCDIVGTIHYSSPEQIRDSRNVDKRADVYSFGAILYHTVCGAPPFVAGTLSGLIQKITTEIPASPVEVRKDAPESLSKMIMRCLAKPRDDRYSSFEEILAELSGMNPGWRNDPLSADGPPAPPINAIIDIAQGEAADKDCCVVEPAHLLIGAIICMEPVPNRLEAMGMDKNALLSRLRALTRQGEETHSVGEIRFGRPARRVIGLAWELAEKGGGYPDGNHMLRALCGEASVEEMMRDISNLPTSQTAGLEQSAGKICSLLELFGLTSHNQIASGGV